MSTPQQQKALYLDKPLGDWVIKTKDVPKPGQGEVLVKIAATALNPADWKVRKFDPPFVPALLYPLLLGFDSTGVIEEVGEGVTSLVKGDRVIHEGSLGDRHATYQQYCVAAAEHVAKLPANISFDQAASIPAGLATAVIGLYADCDRTDGAKKLAPPPWEAGGEGAYKGKAVIVIGGSATVGQFTVQMLKLSGFSKIITTASLHNTEFLKSLGATHIIDRNVDFVTEAKKILDGDSIDLIYDAVGNADLQAQALEMLEPGGQLVAAGGRRPIDKTKYPGKHYITLHADFRSPEYWSLGKSLASKLHDLLASGAVKPNRVEVLPNGLAGVEPGLKRLENNEVSGMKLVIRPGETP
ncbi:GroES-like protein [Schizopora paradoxa]|uniref:GroES-like protein n=1 Tax=Schizopora paradoxa TaxID=27342 RepID=A0A0H2RY29_9AGAM|nr:GroES-like protein [Schizopora paradoxa]